MKWPTLILSTSVIAAVALSWLLPLQHISRVDSFLLRSATVAAIAWFLFQIGSGFYFKFGNLSAAEKIRFTFFFYLQFVFAALGPFAISLSMDIADGQLQFLNKYFDPWLAAAIFLVTFLVHRYSNNQYLAICREEISLGQSLRPIKS